MNRLARTPRHHCRRRFHRTADAAVFSTISGFPVANGYDHGSWHRHSGHDFEAIRADTVGKPLPGMEVRIVNPAADGRFGEVSVRSKTVMAAGY